MLVSLLALVAAGQAGAVVQEPPRTAARTFQERFDTASAAVDDRRCTDAVREFDALRADGIGGDNTLLDAAIDVRRGRCLLGTARNDEGETAIRRGLPVLIAKGADFAGDVREAHLALGSAASGALDYDTAAREFGAAAAISTGVLRIVPLLRLANATMFDHDGTALAAADEARRIATTTPGYDRKDLAAVKTLRARVLLNDGRFKDAYAELRNSLSKQGGLNGKVGISDIATRSDLAIAALKSGAPDQARLYLAYTGAGRMRDTPFTRAAAMEPPTCGGEGGLTPEDQAIVEFSLGEDGHVTGVAPIYATGGRAAAIAFARAVKDWSWRAKDVKEIPAIFRYTTRVELRCITATGAPTVTQPLRDAVNAWLAGKGAGTPAWNDLSAAAALPVQRAALAQAGTRTDAQARVLQAALALAESPVTTPGETPAFIATATAAAQALRAPAMVRTYIVVRNQPETADRREWRALLDDRDVAADPLSGATVRLLIAQPYYNSPPPADAATLLQQVSTDPALPANHPLKVAALLSEANVLASRGDLPAARAVFDRSGLNAEQCAMVGLKPAVRRSGGSSADYPMAAVRLGFEGWARSAFDITADGRTVAPRVVIAYPPFIFDEAASGIARDTRYVSSFRPEGALACAGQQLSVIFKLP